MKNISVCDLLKKSPSMPRVKSFKTKIIVEKYFIVIHHFFYDLFESLCY